MAADLEGRDLWVALAVLAAADGHPTEGHLPGLVSRSAPPVAPRRAADLRPLRTPVATLTHPNAHLIQVVGSCELELPKANS